MYQHLLHLIHIFLLFLVDSYFLNSIPISVLLFTDSYQSYFLPALLNGHPSILGSSATYQRILVVLICIWRIVLLIIITIFFSPMNSREVGYPDAQCASAHCPGVLIQNRQYFKCFYYLNQLRLI